MLAATRYGSRFRTSHKRGLLVCTLGFLGLSGVTSAQANDALTSAPIDYSVYRIGEVKRIEQQYSAWQLTCDEIKRLSRKFCSLRGVARAKDGTIIAALIVSTDENGNPAAILRLPFGTLLSSNVMLRTDPLQKRKPTILALRPTVCDQNGCLVLWPLVPEDIRTLTANKSVIVSFQMTRPPTLLGSLLAGSVPIKGIIQTAGFAAALQASMTR